MYRNAFTLVELIVVITIVSILSTIGFVAYVDYLKGVRDSSRLQQISEIHGSMELYATRSALPFPDENISIVAGSTQVGYQGVAGSSVLDAIRFSNGGKDPGNKKYFTYYLSADRKYAQLLAFFEEQQAGNLLTYQTTSAENNTLYPQVYGSELGLLLEQGTNIPIHEGATYIASGKLDILSITQPVVSYLTNTEQITGTGQALIGMIPNTSCKKLREIFGYTTTGIYRINPSGIDTVNTYCDMETNGGGWTMIMRHASPVGGYTGGFGWKTMVGDAFDEAYPYSMGNAVFSIPFDEVMITSLFPYTEERDDFIFTYQSPVEELKPLATTTKIFPCQTLKPLLKTGASNTTDCTQARTMGIVDQTVGYRLGGRDTGAGGFNVGTNFSVNMNGIQGIIFVR